MLIASPQQIILGGGVMNRASLYPKIRSHLRKILNNYVSSPSLTDEGLEKFIGKYDHILYFWQFFDRLSMVISDANYTFHACIYQVPQFGVVMRALLGPSILQSSPFLLG